MTIDTNVFRVTLSNRGAVATSIQLKQFTNTDGKPVEMVVSRETDRYPFFVSFGNPEAPPEYALFRIERSVVDSNRVDFVRQFRAPSGAPFVLRKTFQFQPNDYLLELRVSIENSLNEYPQLDYQGLAYTLGFGPQSGPAFEKLDRKTETAVHGVRGRQDAEHQSKKGIDQDPEGAGRLGGDHGQVLQGDRRAGRHALRITFEGRPLDGLKDRSSISSAGRRSRAPRTRTCSASTWGRGSARCSPATTARRRTASSWPA